jgi:hypothetical protein
MVLGTAIGALVSLIDESEVLGWLFVSSDGQRRIVPHIGQTHSGLFVLFIVHGWVWTLLVSLALGLWTNASRLHLPLRID